MDNRNNLEEPLRMDLALAGPPFSRYGMTKVAAGGVPARRGGGAGVSPEHFAVMHGVRAGAAAQQFL